eukprot:scaffold10523_cov25-Tisochrysis_lutea.AAC.2
MKAGSPEKVRWAMAYSRLHPAMQGAPPCSITTPASVNSAAACGVPREGQVVHGTVPPAKRCEAHTPMGCQPVSVSGDPYALVELPSRAGASATPAPMQLLLMCDHTTRGKGGIDLSLPC